DGGVLQGPHRGGRRPGVHEGHLAHDLAGVQAGDLPLGAPPALEPDAEPALQEDEDGIDGDALLDEGGARGQEPPGAGGEHPLHVVVVELAEEEEDFSHAARSSLQETLKGTAALFGGYRPLPIGYGAPPNGEGAIPNGERALPSGERPLPSGDGPPPVGERSLPVRERLPPVRERSPPSRCEDPPEREKAAPLTGEVRE